MDNSACNSCYLPLFAQKKEKIFDTGGHTMVTLETFLFASKQIYFLKILFPPVKYFMVTKKKITFYFKYLFSLTIANNVTKFFMFSFYRYLSLICKPSNNRLLTSTRLIFLDIVLNGQFLFRQYVYTRIYTYRVIK